MIVFCEECGERNLIDVEAARKTGEPVRCKACHDLLRFSFPKEQQDSPPAEAVSAPLAAAPIQLELRLGSRVIAISQTRPSVTMGRQEHNDLEVIDTRVSRSHARIEYRKGQFVLIDHSTNGTYVLMNGRQGVNLRRAELPLERDGIIMLGRKALPNSPKAIHFTLRF
ncbi:hypothetical protein DENIS_1165 [Desulfonema ishimotonii]|uniref:FHA domain-containing protein n=1 Tax=Desulfonema ishimotonii TaxID=45657 RepID=A0A401FTD4_9BACT|nr:FHA domain-containing protein [Desulfonema ishimotonii]GBC60214.1 hypothetical protein DENIS_1165 [Desulfonema ishimotonii]